MLFRSAYIYFLSLAGVKESDALIFSVFWFGIILCSSLFGGVFYLKGKLMPAPVEFEPDENDSEEDEPEENEKILLQKPE